MSKEVKRKERHARIKKAQERAKKVASVKEGDSFAVPFFTITIPEENQ